MKEAPSLYTGYTRMSAVFLVQSSDDSSSESDNDYDDNSGNGGDADGGGDGDDDAGSSVRADLNTSLVIRMATWSIATVAEAVLIHLF